MQTRHWEEITRIVGFPLEPDAAFTLQKARRWNGPMCLRFQPEMSMSMSLNLHGRLARRLARCELQSDTAHRGQ